MLTKKELLPRYSALGNHPKVSRDSTSPKGHQDHYQQDFPPEVSNPNQIPNDLGLVTKTQEFPYNQFEWV